MHLQQQSPLFRLPAELREQIYALALTSNDPITSPAQPYYPASPDREIPPLGTALTRTCQAVYRELDISTLYTANTFRFTQPRDIAPFLSHLPPQRRKLINGLSLDLRHIDLDEHAAGTSPGIAAWRAYFMSPAGGDASRRDGLVEVCIGYDVEICGPLTWLELDLRELQRRCRESGSAAERMPSTLREVLRAVLFCAYFLCVEGKMLEGLRELRLVGWGIRGPEALARVKVGMGDFLLRDSYDNLWEDLGGLLEEYVGEDPVLGPV